MKHPFVALILLTLALGCTPTAKEPTPEEATKVRVGDAAPTFSAERIDGSTFSLEEERGKIVLLSFFATWCPPCLEELPHLEKEVWARFGHADLTLLAIGREHDAEELRTFAQEKELSLPIAPDQDRSIYSLYADAFIPRTLVIGPDGVVIYQTADFKPEEFGRMVELVEQALEDLPEDEALTEHTD